MGKKYIGIIALVIVCLVLGGYYALTQRANDVPVYSTTLVATSTSTATTTGILSDPNSSYVADDLDSPYTPESDQKLHIYKRVTLDPTIITINYELKDVTLCGNTYKTKQIFIDGVDVVQRLVQLLDADTRKNDWYCTILRNKTKGHTKATDGMLLPGEEIHIILDRAGVDYSFAPHLGISIDRSRPGGGGSAGEGGYPIYVRPEENKIETYTRVLLGTLR